MTTTVLEGHRVTRRIGTRVIVSAVDVAIEQGESLSLIGPSGCGKTSLLQMLGLLDQPDDGSITIGTHKSPEKPLRDAWSLSGTERAKIRLAQIGFVFQQHNLFETMSAIENVALPSWRLTGSRAGAMKRAETLLDRFGLARVAHTKANELSGGEAQRVAVARAMVNEPEIILADEPTGNLDSASSKVVMDALFEICAQGAALLIVTHDVDIAARASRRIGMFDGSIVRPSQAPPSHFEKNEPRPK